MDNSVLRCLLAALTLVPLSPGAWAQSIVNPIFLEPAGKIDTNRAEIEEKMPLLRKAASPERYIAWMNNESAQRALRLYRAAWDIVHPDGGVPDYYVALVPDGNHAAVGFRLQTGGEVREFPRQPYILLDAQPSRFEGTMLHETGHMAMALVAGGRQLEGRPMASIPHSTAALSDRNTAFSEGYAIHLETLAAHLNRNADSLRRFHREGVEFGGSQFQTAEYFRHSVDLTSYSQSLARYLEVRDNNYAFDSAYQGPDYLRVQLEKARDFATVRDANQLLQSEGFYASFFFLWVVRGAGVPAANTIDERERQILGAMHTMFGASTSDASSPWLIQFVLAYMQQFPAEKAAIADALNDLSHGVFVDAGAASLWKHHYLAALRLDFSQLNAQGIAQARKEWREKVLEDPQVLFQRLGPEIGCTLPGTKVRLEVFGKDEPVQFDINTVPPGILRLIPGIAESEVAQWIAERARQPFASAGDLRQRGFLRGSTLAALRF